MRFHTVAPARSCKIPRLGAKACFALFLMFGIQIAAATGGPAVRFRILDGGRNAVPGILVASLKCWCPVLVPALKILIWSSAVRWCRFRHELIHRTRHAPGTHAGPWGEQSRRAWFDCGSKAALRRWRRGLERSVAHDRPVRWTGPLFQFSIQWLGGERSSCRAAPPRGACGPPPGLPRGNKPRETFVLARP